MRAQKLGILLVLVLVIGGGVFGTLALADAPPHTTGWSANPPTADSLVVGAPYEDAGSVTDAGVIQLIYGQTSTGLVTNTSEYIAQTSSTGSVEAYDYFGKNIAVADFNRDGYYDIAVGVPGDNNGPFFHAGAVNIFYGSETGFTTTNDDYLAFTDIDPVGAHHNIYFGAALTTGDFNGDGVPDLAASAPGYDVMGATSVYTDEGAVFILWGSSTGSGLTTAASAKYEGDDVNDGSFGNALVAADFNGDGKDDLVIGAPNHSIPAPMLHPARGGQVYILTDTTTTNYVSFVQPVINNTGPSDGNRFGASLAVGDFNGDEHPDLAVGVPRQNWEGNPWSLVDVGAVNILYNDGNGLSTTGAQAWMQNDINQTSNAFDEFGYSVAGGDFDKNGVDDLVIGTPYKDITTTENSGTITYTDTGMIQIVGGVSGVGITTTVFLPVYDTGYIKSVNQHYGMALTVGDFDKDGTPDIVGGVPGYTVDGYANAGAIFIIDHIHLEPSFTFYALQRLNQKDLPGVAAEQDDYFGWALATLPAPLSHKVYLPLLLR